MAHRVCNLVVLLLTLATIGAQITTFGPFGASLADSQQQQLQQLQHQQQQLFQSAGTPVQGLRLQLNNPAGYNLFQSVQTGTRAADFNQKYILQIKVKPTADRILKYEAHLVPAKSPVSSREAVVNSAFPASAQPALSPALPQQPLQLSNSVLASAAQFRNNIATSGTIAGPTRTAGQPVPTTGVLGVAFSPASDVSQLRFSGSFANYSY
ncbi:uncharacterized protein [Periplaneta americana]|uniref:uncharacterized protein isoform X1 n=1 Tax=Periplaneta americana TaxID=6978 RepID=UPI0037E98FA9